VWIQALGVIDHNADGTPFPVDFMSRSLPHKVPLGQDPAGRYEIVSSYNIGFSVLRSGHSDNVYLNLTAVGPGWGEMVNMVEIYAQAPTWDEGGRRIGYEDWMFCIDDLDIEWLDLNAMKDLTEDVRKTETSGRASTESRFMVAHIALGMDGILKLS
jgi:hypothetical protein